MEPHNHPDYERTFERIATLLETTVTTMQKIVATTEKIVATTEKVVATTEKVVATMDRLAIKSAETEDKLNALIELMDRHLREHNEGKNLN